MTEEIYKTKTSTKSISSSIIACVVFGAIAFYLHMKIGNSDTFVMILLVLSILALMYLRKTKEIILTKKSIIINYVFLPIVKKYNFEDIEKLDEDEFELSASTSNYTETTFHKGKRTIVTFKNLNKTLLLDSYEIQDYYVLMRHIRKVTKKLEPDFVGDPIEYGKFEQKIYGRQSYLWFGMILVYVLLTILFIVSKINGG